MLRDEKLKIIYLPLFVIAIPSALNPALQTEGLFKCLLNTFVTDSIIFNPLNSILLSAFKKR